MKPLYPGVALLAQGGERRPPAPPLISAVPQLLWRPQTFRVTVPPLTPTPLFAQRGLVVGLEIYADENNTSRVLIGNSLIQSATAAGDGVPGNNYFQLSRGRHVYIWTDKPETEVFDVAMYFATHDGAGDQYLHCTHWQPQLIAGPR